MPNYNGQYDIPYDPNNPLAERRIECAHLATQMIRDPQALDVYRRGPEAIVDYFSNHGASGGLSSVVRTYNRFINDDQSTRQIVQNDQFGNWLNAMGHQMILRDQTNTTRALILTPDHAVAMALDILPHPNAPDVNTFRVTAFDPNRTTDVRVFVLQANEVAGMTLERAFPELRDHPIGQTSGGLVATMFSPTTRLQEQHGTPLRDRTSFLGLAGRSAQTQEAILQNSLYAALQYNVTGAIQQIGSAMRSRGYTGNGALMLIASGALNNQHNSEVSALAMAALHGGESFSAVPGLLQTLRISGNDAANVLRAESGNQPALYWAALRGDLPTVKAITQAAVTQRQQDPNFRSQDAIYVLRGAADTPASSPTSSYGSDDEGSQRSRSASAGPSTPAYWNESMLHPVAPAIHAAAMAGHPRVIALIAQAAGHMNLSPADRLLILEGRDGIGRPALHSAVRWGHYNVYEAMARAATTADIRGSANITHLIAAPDANGLAAHQLAAGLGISAAFQPMVNALEHHQIAPEQIRQTLYGPNDSTRAMVNTLSRSLGSSVAGEFDRVDSHLQSAIARNNAQSQSRAQPRRSGRSSGSGSSGDSSSRAGPSHKPRHR